MFFRPAAIILGLLLNTIPSVAFSQAEDRVPVPSVDSQVLELERILVRAEYRVGTDTSFEGSVLELPQLGFTDLGRQSNSTKGLRKIDVWEALGPTATSEPDPDIAVGPSHVIQAIETGGNTIVEIRRKGDGQRLTSFAMNNLGGGSTWCGSDLPWFRTAPFVSYDRYADRWILGHIGSYRESDEWNGWTCMYVSKTSDPITGGWYVYRVDTDGTRMPFAPILGVRRNAYVLSMYLMKTAGGDAAPSGHNNSIWVFNRQGFVSGSPGTFFRIPLNNFQFLRGAHRSGVFTHEGWRKERVATPLLWYRVFDDEYHQSALGNPSLDFLEVGSFEANFDEGTGTSTTRRVPIADFDTTACPDLGNCLVQPWGPSLVQHIDRMPHGKISRPLTDTEYLVGSFPVFYNGAAAVRWFEFKSDGGAPWQLTQEGLFTSAGANLTSPSISRDWRGNIALIANKVGSSIFPSIVRRGHEHDDSPGAMTTSERLIAEGTDVHSERFWSDTRSILDPFDQCSIWSTGMYTPNSEWDTIISRIEFTDCQPEILSSSFEAGLTEWSNVIQ